MKMFRRLGAVSLAAALMASTTAIVAYADAFVEDGVIVIEKSTILDGEKIVITYTSAEDSAEKLGVAVAPDWAWKEYEFTLPAGENATYEIKLADIRSKFGMSSNEDFGDLTKIYNAGGEASLLKVEVVAAPKAEETTAATEAPKEETTAAKEEEKVEETTAAAEEEEEWVSTFDPSTVKFDADEAPYYDGLQFALRADNEAQDSLEKSFGFDITSVYGIKVYVEVDSADVEHGAWYGGSVGANCPSRGWYQHNFANGDGDELTYVESEGSITFQQDEPIFSEDDGYAFAFFQQWGTPMGVKKFELLDKAGNVIDYKAGGSAEEAVEEAPEVIAPAPAAGDVAAATDSTKGSPDTGIADVAAVAGIAVAAAGAFIVAKKRK